MKTYKVKMYPKPHQVKRMESWLAAMRNAYNYGLDLIDIAHKDYGIGIKELKLGQRIAKHRNLTPSLRAVPERIVSYTVTKKLELAWARYFALLKSKSATEADKSKGRPRYAGWERFKSFKTDEFNIVERKGKTYVVLPPRVGPEKGKMAIQIRGGELPKAAKVSASDFISSPDGWYACLVIEPENSTRWEAAPHGAIGIDVNIGAIDLSDGTRIPMPFFADRYRDEVLRLTQKLARTRRDNKQWRSSKRYAEAQKRKGVLEARVARERRAWQADVVAWLVSRYDRIYVENLEPKNMVKNKHLSSAISAQSWGQFFDMLELKCAEHGRIFGRVPAAYTSKTCSACGWINKAKQGEKGHMGLHVRKWDCPECGAHHNRDVNAAQNVLARGEEALATDDYVKQELGGRKANAGGKVIITERVEPKTSTVMIPCPVLTLPIPPNLPVPKRRSKAEWAAKQRAERAKRRNKAAKNLSSVDARANKKNSIDNKKKLAISTQLSLFCDA